MDAALPPASSPENRTREFPLIRLKPNQSPAGAEPVSRRFNSGLLASDAKLLLERTFREAVPPVQIERVGIPPDLTWRQIWVSPAYVRLVQIGLPSGFCLPVLVANIQARLCQAGKQGFFTMSRDFLGCRRLAHCQSARQILWSTRSSVSVAAQCRG
jgi:hypothetical protein